MSALPREFRKIRLELAREPAHPQGDNKTGYLITLPLNAEMRIDAAIWKSFRDNCRVVRMRADDWDVGHVIHGPGGNWMFRYDISGDQEDETGFKLQDEKFVPGEYVSIREGDLIRTYRVLSVEHV